MNTRIKILIELLKYVLSLLITEVSFQGLFFLLAHPVWTVMNNG